MQPQRISLGGVIDQFRFAFGTADWRRVTLPSFLLDLGAKLGDLANRLGWMPPMRSTAIAELRRGVTGDPAPWMAATGIVPKTIAEIVGQRAATIQDKWFARLFLIKALVIASLALFWIVSGFIALVISFPATKAILASHGFPSSLVAPVCRRHQPDGYEYRRADRVPPHLRVRACRGHRRSRSATWWGRRSSRRSLDRAARRAGQDRARDRADGGRAVDIG